jgi:hypothetical protein
MPEKKPEIKKKKFPRCIICGSLFLKKRRFVQNWGWTFVRICENPECPNYMDPSKTKPPIFKKKDIKKFPELKKMKGTGIIINGLKTHKKRMKKNG